MEDIRRLIEYVEHAENEIHQIMVNVEGEKGYQSIYNRADTVFGKLENLKWLLINKRREGK